MSTHRVLIEPVPGMSPVFFELPFDAKETFGKVRAPVVVTIGSYSFRTTVAAMGGKQVIGLNKENRTAAGVEAGQAVSVRIVFDDEERTVTPPQDLVRALKASKDAWERWKKLSYTHRKEHVRAIEETKRPETRQRRIAKAVAAVSS